MTVLLIESASFVCLFFFFLTKMHKQPLTAKMAVIKAKNIPTEILIGSINSCGVSSLLETTETDMDVTEDVTDDILLVLPTKK